jgi:hypothetical protein
MAAAFTCTCTGIRTCVDTYLLRWHLNWNLCNGRI